MCESKSAYGVLVLSNLVTGWKLYSSAHTAKEQSRQHADMAVGQIHEALRELQPVSSPVDADDTDRILRAAQKLQTAYEALYELERRNELPVSDPGWPQVVNAIRGQLPTMIVSHDYTNLPTVKRRMDRLARLVPLDNTKALPRLRETHKLLVMP